MARQGVAAQIAKRKGAPCERALLLIDEAAPYLGASTISI